MGRRQPQKSQKRPPVSPPAAANERPLDPRQALSPFGLLLPDPRTQTVAYMVQMRAIRALTRALEQQQAAPPGIPHNLRAPKRSGLPTPKNAGRPPTVPLDVFSAHVTDHPGLSDQQRARMLSYQLKRKVSRQQVLRLRRRMELDSGSNPRQ